MTSEQVVKLLRRMRYERLPSMRSLAATARVNRNTLYRAIHSGECSRATAAAVQQAMRQLAPIHEV